MRLLLVAITLFIVIFVIQDAVHCSDSFKKSSSFKGLLKSSSFKGLLKSNSFKLGLQRLKSFGSGRSKEESDDEESDDEESKEKKKKRPEDCCDSCDVNKGAIIPNKVDYEKKYGEGRTGNLCFKHKSCKQCAKKMLYRNKQCWICFNKYMGTYWGVEDDETKKDHEEEQAKNQDDVSTS